MKQIIVSLRVDRKQKERIRENCPDAELVFVKPEDDLYPYRKVKAVVGFMPVRRLAVFEDLEWYQAESAGVDRYMGFLPDKVVLTNGSGAFGYAMAEQMVGAVYFMAKNFGLYRDQQKKHEWKYLGAVKDVGTMRVMSIGMGDIGSGFLKRMKALGCTTVGVRRTLREKPEWCDELVTMEQLDDQLEKADVVALSLPATAETRHLIDAERLSKFKQGAFLINVGRGSAIKTDDLVEAVKEKRLGGVWLDVTDPEPLTPDHPLWDLPQVFITPHVSGNYSLYRTMVNMTDIVIENINRYVHDQPLMNVVDREAGYRDNLSGLKKPSE